MYLFFPIFFSKLFVFFYILLTANLFMFLIKSSKLYFFMIRFSYFVDTTSGYFESAGTTELLNQKLQEFC